MSNEIAQRLKAAGFPQPTPAAKQIWYDAFGYERIVGGKGKTFTLLNLKNALLSIVSADSTFWAEAAYSPTAQDILEALPFGCSTGRTSDGFAAKWQYHPQEFATYTAPTLVEALAKAYLAVCT